MSLSYDEKVLHFAEQMEMMRKLDALPAQNGIRASAQASMNLINLYSREIERVEKAEESLAAYEEGVDPEDPLAVECNAYANLYREHEELKRKLSVAEAFIDQLIDAGNGRLGHSVRDEAKWIKCLKIYCNKKEAKK